MQEQPGKGDPIRVLLVDDDETTIELTTLNLENLSLKVTSTTKPSEALRLLSEQIFDCIVSDYQMPEMNGIQLCIEVKKTGEVPFIIYTGHGSEEVASAAFSAGAYNYVRKEETLAHYQILARIIRHAVEKRRTEEALKVSEERFSKAFGISPVPLAITRYSDGIYIDVNDSFLRIFGYSRSEVIDHSSNEIHIFAKPEGRKVYISAFKNRRVTNLELDFKTKDGDHVEGLVSSEMISVNDQDLIISTIVDITERKRAEDDLRRKEDELRITNEELSSANEELQVSEEELQSQTEELVELNKILTESEEKYSYLVKYAPTAIYEVDFVNKRFTSVNDAMCRVVGYTREELLDMSPMDILDNESTRLFLDRVRRAQNGEPIDESVEYKVMKRDGSWIWGVLNIKFTYKEDKIVGAFVIAHDVTARKLVEEQLRESEERYRQIVEFATVAIYELSLNGDRFLSINEATASILGYTRDELMAKSPRSILDVESQVIFSERIRNKLAGNPVPTPFEYKVVDKKGLIHIILLNDVEFRNKDGEPISVVVIASDITDRKRSEEALVEQKALLETILDQAASGIMVCDSKGKLIFINKVAREINGQNPGDSVEEHNVLSVYDSDGKPIPGKDYLLFNALRGETITGVERRFVLPDGTSFWALSSASPVRNSRGEIIAAVSTHVNISDTKKAEEELKTFNEELQSQTEELHASEEMSRLQAEELKTILNVIPAAVWVSHDPECRVIEGNAAANRFYEAAEGENVSAGPASGGEHDATRRFFRNGVELKPEELPMQEAASKNMDVRNSELEVTQPSGGRISILGSASPLRDRNGNVVGCVATFIDVTEKRVLEDKLRAYTDKLEQIVSERTEKLRETNQVLEAFRDSATEGLSIYDKDLNLIETNQVVVNRFPSGTRKEDLIGKNIRALYPGVEATEWYQGYQRLLRGGEPWHVERRRGVGASGSLMLEASAFRVGDGIGVISRDVTRSVEIEERLHRAEVTAAVDQMGATVAHDLRGPLGQIVQSIQMAKRDPRLVPRMLQLAEESAVRSLRMIADWRSSTREIVPQLVKTDLGAFVEHVIGGTTILSKVEVITSVGKGLNSVKTDPDIMHRVLDNLVKNAVESMPDGGKLLINAERVGGEVLISIGDTGVGIPDESKEHIFSPLYTTKAGGMGLGLTYCRRAIEAMGGSIDFKSEVGVGTTFTIKLQIQ